MFIYPVDRSWLDHGVKLSRIISTLIDKLFIILHIYYILTGIDHVLDILLSYVIRTHLSWHQIPIGMSTPRSIPKIDDGLRTLRSIDHDSIDYMWRPVWHHHFHQSQTQYLKTLL